LCKKKKELRFLKIYAGPATLICAIVFLSAFDESVSKNAKFDEMDVKRINILDKDRKLLSKSSKFL